MHKHYLFIHHHPWLAIIQTDTSLNGYEFINNTNEDYKYILHMLSGDRIGFKIGVNSFDKEILFNAYNELKSKLITN